MAFNGVQFIIHFLRQCQEYAGTLTTGETGERRPSLQKSSDTTSSQSEHEEATSHYAKPTKSSQAHVVYDESEELRQRIDDLPPDTANLHTIMDRGQPVPAVVLSREIGPAIVKSIVRSRRWDQDLGQMAKARKTALMMEITRTEQQLLNDDLDAIARGDLCHKALKLGDEWQTCDMLQHDYVNEAIDKMEWSMWYNLRDKLIRAGWIPPSVEPASDNMLLHELQKVRGLENVHGNSPSVDDSANSSIYGRIESDMIPELLITQREELRAARQDHKGRNAADAVQAWEKTVRGQGKDLPEQEILDQYALVKRTEAIHRLREAERAYKRIRRKAREAQLDTRQGVPLTDDSGLLLGSEV